MDSNYYEQVLTDLLFLLYEGSGIIARTKYNVSKDESKRTYEDIIFQSEVEMTYYRDWILPRIKSGEIIKCDRQVKYVLQPAFEIGGTKYREICFISDFDITYADGRFEVIDVKGMVKPIDNLHKKMFLYHYPLLNLIWIGKSLIDGGYVPIEVINKGRKERKKAKEKEKTK